MDRDKLSNPYRGLSMDASCQVMVHLAKRFQRRNYLEIVNQKQELGAKCGVVTVYPS
jgi:hypothetical protein